MVTNIGQVKPREITEEMKDSYIDYAMSVIVSRALPDVRDGLKPVHRRILYAMHEDGLTHVAKFRKSATVVGSVLGRYHPHGDVAVYDSMARMAQDFSLRYPLIQGQGNWGCFTKDTEVKLSDGRNLSFEGLIEEQEKGKKHWGFTFNFETQKIEIAEIKSPRLTRKNEELIEIILDNKEKIRCTPNHRFMLKDGSYKEAEDLKAGESLMRLPDIMQNKKPAFGADSSESRDNPMILGLSPISIITDQRDLSSVNNIKPWRRGELHPGDSRRQPGISDYPAPTANLLYHNNNCNHKVIKTRFLRKKEDVYDLTIGPWHNFALAAGIFVHNSIDGDSAAAMRYTECKMSKLGEEMLRDISKNTVDFIDNYDATRKEPQVLPSPAPQLLLNGSLGIAVGMATNIPPHNLSEVIDASIYLLDHPKADTEDLFQFVKGPDFPTGGIIYNQKEILEAYSQGKGSIVTRGKAEILEKEATLPAGQAGGQTRIVITEIPFQVIKSSLIEKLANLVQEKKIEGIKDIRDESDKDGLRIVIDLQRDAHPQKILNRLYKFSDLQKTFHLNMLALVDGIQPRVLSLNEVIGYYLAHRQEVVQRRTKYDLEKAKERAHILEGLHKCLNKIDAVIKTIRASASREDALKNLMRKFKLTQLQANAILETKLAALAKLERKKIEDELKEMLVRIKEFTVILKSPQKIKEVVAKELKEIKEAFGDERKTKVYVQPVGEIAEEDLIPQEESIITLTQGGYIKRINPALYKKQNRGGKGMVGMKTLGEDMVEHFLTAMTHDALLFFTDSGKVFRTPVYEIPEGTRVAKGRGLLNFLELSTEEKVLSLQTLGKQDQEQGIKYLVIVTKNGIIKKSSLADFDNIRRSGLIAISLRKDDAVKGVRKTTGNNDIILVTKKGQSICFKEKDARAMGRTASGTRGIRLKKGDEVVAMDVTSAKCQPGKCHLLVVSENGYGKRTDLREYKLQGRGGSGIKTVQVTAKTGNLASAMILTGEEEDLIVISQKGQVIRTKIATIAKLGRATQGVRIMRLDPGDKVASAACL